MGDEDLCECIMNHELYIRRLLNIIRNGQTYCTDTECLDISITPSETLIGSANMFLLTGIMIMAMMYLSLRSMNRRNSIFNVKDDDQDSDDESDDFEDPPPGPCPAAGTCPVTGVPTPNYK